VAAAGRTGLLVTKLKEPSVSVQGCTSMRSSAVTPPARARASSTRAASATVSSGFALPPIPCGADPEPNYRPRSVSSPGTSTPRSPSPMRRGRAAAGATGAGAPHDDGLARQRIRDLWRLHHLGRVSTLGPEHESVRFDPKLVPHHHSICARCGLVRSHEGAELSALRIPQSVSEFGRVDARHVEVRGVQSRCEKKQTRKT
jgi:hypothetical protein